MDAPWFDIMRDSRNPLLFLPDIHGTLHIRFLFASFPTNKVFNRRFSRNSDE